MMYLNQIPRGRRGVSSLGVVASGGVLAALALGWWVAESRGADGQQVDLARTALVERRLAACVQIVGPIRSTYRWKEQIETTQEWQCVAKTRRELYERVEEAVKSLHPYEVPEILAVPIVAASDTEAVGSILGSPRKSFKVASRYARGFPTSRQWPVTTTPPSRPWCIDGRHR